MKRLKKILRLCALILFMLLAVAGIGIFGIAPVLTKDRKLFADIEVVSENTQEDGTENTAVNMEKDIKF